MKRRAMKRLIDWKNQDARKPLLLQGVRQVGKTYLLKRFGSEHFARTHIVNFEDPTFHSVFEQGPVDVEAALMRIQIILGREIDRASDLLFFDEIQDCPEAIHALKYFYEKMPGLALVCAGSHVGISGSNLPFPVGKVNFEILHPLTFGEFLQEYNPPLSAAMHSAIAEMQIDDFLHNKLWDAYLLYSLVGGMPEPVATFLSESDRYSALKKARAIQHELVKGYVNDFSKYCGKSLAHRISSVFRSIPDQLQTVHDKSTKRYQFKGVLSNNTKYSHLQTPIDWLIKSGLALKIPIASKPEPPLSAYCRQNIFKLFAFDIGVLNAQLNLDFGVVLNQNVGSYKGFIAECFVAQQLQLDFHERIYSWQKNRSEIEFILPYRELIIPVEVKSGNRTKSKSLAEYKKKYAPHLAVKLSGKNMRVEKSHLNAPIYLAEYLDSMLASLC